MSLFELVRTKIEDQRKIATVTPISYCPTTKPNIDILVNGDAGNVNELGNALLCYLLAKLR
jgi:hypothetical protein